MPHPSSPLGQPVVSPCGETSRSKLRGPLSGPLRGPLWLLAGVLAVASPSLLLAQGVGSRSSALARFDDPLAHIHCSGSDGTTSWMLTPDHPFGGYLRGGVDAVSYESSEVDPGLTGDALLITARDVPGHPTPLSLRVSIDIASPVGDGSQKAFAAVIKPSHRRAPIVGSCVVSNALLTYHSQQDARAAQRDADASETERKLAFLSKRMVEVLARPVTCALSKEECVRAYSGFLRNRSALLLNPSVVALAFEPLSNATGVDFRTEGFDPRGGGRGTLVLRPPSSPHDTEANTQWQALLGRANDALRKAGGAGSGLGTRHVCTWGLSEVGLINAYEGYGTTEDEACAAAQAHCEKLERWGWSTLSCAFRESKVQTIAPGTPTSGVGPVNPSRTAIVRVGSTVTAEWHAIDSARTLLDVRLLRTSEHSPLPCEGRWNVSNFRINTAPKTLCEFEITFTR